jgi:hypothetical protein
MTGLDEQAIQDLVDVIDDILTASGQLPAATGRPSVLDLFDQVVMTVTLMRHNITQELIGGWFGVSQPRVSQIKSWIEPLIDQALNDVELSLAEATHKRVVVVDGTYVPTGNRKATGKTNYSGKRHCQCLSVQVACDLNGRLLAMSDPVPGRRHDQAALSLCGWDDTLADADWIADSAYIATNAVTPVKRAPGIELCAWQRQFNHALSKIRCVVERCIAHLKNWKILKTGYRRQLKKLPDTIRLATKLELYRLAR